MRDETQVQSGPQVPLKDIPADREQVLTPEQAEGAKGGVGPVDGVIQPSAPPIGPIDGKRAF